MSLNFSLVPAASNDTSVIRLNNAPVGANITIPSILAQQLGSELHYGQNHSPLVIRSSTLPPILFDDSVSYQPRNQFNDYPLYNARGGRGGSRGRGGRGSYQGIQSSPRTMEDVCSELAVLKEKMKDTVSLTLFHEVCRQRDSSNKEREKLLEDLKESRGETKDAEAHGRYQREQFNTAFKEYTKERDALQQRNSLLEEELKIVKRKLVRDDAEDQKRRRVYVEEPESSTSDSSEESDSGSEVHEKILDNVQLPDHGKIKETIDDKTMPVFKKAKLACLALLAVATTVAITLTGCSGTDKEEL